MPARFMDSELWDTEILLAREHQSVTPKDNFFVISGCSGSGKSTLLEALQQHGDATVPEPGRRVVQEHLQAGTEGLPWVNMQQFAEGCLVKTRADFKLHLEVKTPVFFDRSLIDIVSAVEAFKLRMPADLADALLTMRYAQTVFISAPWKALFQSDNERRHSFADAVHEYEFLVNTYRVYGYNLVMLPQLSVQERVRFIHANLGY